jgi:putative pyruvate formate lyase activating enzyme
MDNKSFSIESKIAILKKNKPAALAMLADCTVCPRLCHVDRTKGEPGRCGMPEQIKIASANLHHGEEPPISGARGSGTIFLSGCNLSCVYCQNYPISQYRNGEFVSIEDTAGLMLSLERRGAHNINFVTPTHYVPQLMAAMLAAYKAGLTIPIVYNSSGYDSVGTLKLLEGVVEIYMPDMRYADGDNAAKYSGAADYPEINRAAIKEMNRQVGVLQIENEIAVQGLLIRHLVLPDNIAGSKEIFDFIAAEISPDTYLAVMSQYFPAYKACDMPVLSRRLTHEEYDRALDDFEESGLHNGFIQPFLGE